MNKHIEVQKYVYVTKQIIRRGCSFIFNVNSKILLQIDHFINILIRHNILINNNFKYKYELFKNHYDVLINHIMSIFISNSYIHYACNKVTIVVLQDE